MNNQNANISPSSAYVNNLAKHPIKDEEINQKSNSNPTKQADQSPSDDINISPDSSVANNILSEAKKAKGSNI